MVFNCDAWRDRVSPRSRAIKSVLSTKASATASSAPKLKGEIRVSWPVSTTLASAATSMTPATLPKTMRMIRANTFGYGLIAGFLRTSVPPVTFRNA